MSLKNNYYAVILAGGSGTRFWPLSRQKKPKQFLNILGKRTFLQDTVQRITSKIPSKNILIVTNKDYRSEVSRQLKGFGILKENILLEPAGKNTAPAIGWAASKIHAVDPDALIAVLPSDHYIEDPLSFLKILEQSFYLAQKDFLVTLGIEPTRPEIGFGYMQGKKKVLGKIVFYAVERFVEKPPLKDAQHFLKSGNYFWNSGMFFFKASVILENFREYLPDVMRVFMKGSSSRSFALDWRKLSGISIDHGILQKARNVVAIPAGKIGWNDIGSWVSLKDVLKKDKEKNILKGDVFTWDSSNTLIFGHERFIAAVGLKDLVIVDTKDALLVCHKDHSQEIRNVVEYLKKNKKRIY